MSGRSTGSVPDPNSSATRPIVRIDRKETTHAPRRLARARRPRHPDASRLRWRQLRVQLQLRFWLEGAGPGRDAGLCARTGVCTCRVCTCRVCTCRVCSRELCAGGMCPCRDRPRACLSSWSAWTWTSSLAAGARRDPSACAHPTFSPWHAPFLRRPWSWPLREGLLRLAAVTGAVATATPPSKSVVQPQGPASEGRAFCCAERACATPAAPPSRAVSACDQVRPTGLVQIGVRNPRARTAHQPEAPSNMPNAPPALAPRPV